MNIHTGLQYNRHDDKRDQGSLWNASIRVQCLAILDILLISGAVDAVADRLVATVVEGNEIPDATPDL